MPACLLHKSDPPGNPHPVLGEGKTRQHNLILVNKWFKQQKKKEAKSMLFNYQRHNLAKDQQDKRARREGSRDLEAVAGEAAAIMRSGCGDSPFRRHRVTATVTRQQIKWPRRRREKEGKLSFLAIPIF